MSCLPAPWAKDKLLIPQSGRQNVEAMDKHIQFVFVGGGMEVENLKSLAQELEVGNVLFLPRMPIHEVGRVLAAAEVLLVHLKDDPLYETTIPSKTQAYMSIGKPILMAVKGDAAQLIATAGAGHHALPENEVSLAEAVLTMRRLPSATLLAMGRRGAEFYSQNLSLTLGAEKFLEIFNAVVVTANR